MNGRVYGWIFCTLPGKTIIHVVSPLLFVSNKIDVFACFLCTIYINYFSSELAVKCYHAWYFFLLYAQSCGFAMVAAWDCLLPVLLLLALRHNKFTMIFVLSWLSVCNVSGLINLKELQISNSSVTDFGITYLRGTFCSICYHLQESQQDYSCCYCFRHTSSSLVVT